MHIHVVVSLRFHSNTASRFPQEIDFKLEGVLRILALRNMSIFSASRGYGPGTAYSLTLSCWG